MDLLDFFENIQEKMRQFKKKKLASGGTKKSIKNRTRGVAIVMAIGCLYVMSMMAWLQIINSEEYQQRAISQQLHDTELPAKRGTIYDANMEPLVQSTTAWLITIDPPTIDEKCPEKKDAIVKKIAEVLEVSEESIWERMNIQTLGVKILVKADKEQRDELESFLIANKIVGVGLQVDTERAYTHGTLASTILGFTSFDNDGMMGLEAWYNTDLSGVDGRVVEAKNALNGAMPFDYQIIVDAKEGSSLVMTIDANCQAVLEKYLRQAVIENKIKNRACGILMNVNTGAIVAMATLPDYDPANHLEVADKETAEKIASLQEAGSDEWASLKNAAQWAQWRNKAVSDTYEPGSVFKPVTMAAALEEGVTTLNDGFYCPGYKVVGGIKRNCHRTSGHGSESLTQGMMNSCNPVFMTLSERLGGSGFYKYFEAFGFTEKTGIDLPDEAVGIWHSEANLNKHAADLAAASFGQTNTVTPLQMITAISAISNGGYLVQPHVVAEIIDSEGNVISTAETNVKRQVISSQTSDIINNMLEKVVSGGTAKNGYIAGYRIGGKTGTSEKIAETAQTGIKTYVASFCAIAPSDDPEYALLIVLDDPRGTYHMGGTIAAPVARNVLSEVLPYLGVETIYSSSDMATLDVKTPTLIGKTTAEAKDEAAAKGLKLRVVGDGETITAQIPPAGQNIPKGGTVVVSTDSDAEVPMTKVPDVVGMTPSEANKAIVNARLNIRYEGSGYDSSKGVALSQSIPKGTEVEQGTVVSVEFIMSGSTD